MVFLSIDSREEGQTKEIGFRLGERLRPQSFVHLKGELGAGKTHFAKGVAASQGIPEHHVTSPTFSLIQEYRGTIPIFHMDLYRLEKEYELEDLGYEEYFYGQGITLVEWGDLAKAYFPPTYLEVEFLLTGEKERRLLFFPYGEFYLSLVKELKAVYL